MSTTSSLIHLIKSALRGSFARRVGVLVGGTALGQLLVALSSPVITRLYSPEEIGLLSVFVAVLSPLLSMASFRYAVATVLPREEEEAASIIYLSLGIVVGTALLTTVVVATAGETIAAVVGAPGLAPYLILLPISFLGGGCFQVLSYWGIRRKTFGVIAQARLMQSLSTVILQISLGLSGLASLGLILGDGLSRIVGTFRLARDLFSTRRTHGRPTIASIRKVAVTYKRFPMFSIGPALVNSINLQLPTLLIAREYDAATVGLFALGFRLLGSPLNIVSKATGQVFLGDFAEAALNTSHALQKRFSKAWRILLLIASSTVFPVAIIGTFTFETLFGATWNQAGTYLLLMSPMLVAQFVSSPLGSILDVLERQDLHVIREVIRTGFMIFGVLIYQAVGSSAYHLVLSLSLSTAAGYVVGLLMIRYAIAHHLLVIRD